MACGPAGGRAQSARPPLVVRQATRRLALAALLPLAAALSGCDGENAASAVAAPRPPSLTVAVAAVERRPLETKVLASGTVAAWREVAVGAEANGLAVREVAVEEGASVRRGDLLVQLNDASVKAEIDQQTADIEEASANLDLAKLELRRAEQLTASRAISQQDADEKRSTVRADTAKLASAKAALAKLEASRDQTRILAPVDGVVSKRSIDPGEVVSTGTELIRIIQDGRLQLDASVAEADLASVAPRQAARVHAPSGVLIAGVVREIAPLVDGMSRLGVVRIDLPAKTGLRPGMFARAEIASAPTPALVAPRRALVWRADKPYVLALDAGQVARLRPVRLGRSNGDDVEIVEGLAERDTVVSAGAGFLSDGDRVGVGASVASNQPDAVQ